MIEKLRRHRVLLNALVGQVLWFVCVLGGVRHADVWVVATVVPLVGLQLLLPEQKRGRLAVHVLVVTVYGVIVDTLLTGAQVFEPVRTGIAHPWCPIWLAALWLNFASMAAICLRRLGEKPWLAILAGAVGGPMAYAGGMRLEALTFPCGDLWAMAVLAVAWSVTAGLALVTLPALLGGGGAVGTTGTAKISMAKRMKTDEDGV